MDFALDAQWFIGEPFSLHGKIGLGPIIDQLDAPEPPFLWDLEFGAGVHIQNFEVFGTYRSLIPSIDPDQALHGPELGLRIWF